MRWPGPPPVRAAHQGRGFPRDTSLRKFGFDANPNIDPAMVRTLAMRMDQEGPAPLPHRRGSLGARIREARLVPYQAVVGAKEAADDHVALRLRDGRRLDPQQVGDVLTHVGALIGAHSTDLWADATS